MICVSQRFLLRRQFWVVDLLVAVNGVDNGRPGQVELVHNLLWIVSHHLAFPVSNVDRAIHDVDNGSLDWAAMKGL